MFGRLIVSSQGINEPGDSWARAIYATKIFQNNVVERRNLLKQVVKIILDTQEEVGLATLHPGKTMVVGDKLRKIQPAKEKTSKNLRACPQFRTARFASIYGAHVLPHANGVSVLSVARQN